MIKAKNMNKFLNTRFLNKILFYMFIIVDVLTSPHYRIASLQLMNHYMINDCMFSVIFLAVSRIKRVIK